MIRIQVDKVSASVTENETLTKGRVGLECAFSFSEDWNGLAHFAVFEGAEVKTVVLDSTNQCIVPAECLAEAGYRLRIGACGIAPDGSLVIPTIWAKVGKIVDSATLPDEELEKATPAIIEQITQKSDAAYSMAVEVTKRANAGEFNGQDGQDGADGVGVPDGGATGQYLRKATGTDYDTEWATMPTAPTEVFWATYGTTTSAEIEAAYQAKKEVLCEYGDMIYALRYRGNSTTHTFVAYMNSSGYYVRCSSDVWANGSISLAPLNSPTLTGTPKAPTAAAGTDTTQIATTAFVQGELDGVHQVPAGGSSGYVLKKASGTDYDLEWAAESGGGGGGTTEVFWATYGTTTNADIETAYQAGEVCACIRNGYTYYLVERVDADEHVFACVDGAYMHVVYVTDDVWGNDDFYIGSYSKPAGGIPASDLASAVQTSLGKADTALQSAPVTSVNSKTGAVTLSASDVGAGTYSKPSGGIPSTDLASAVQTSLGKADTALQSYTETDPTVPSWAKAASKPSYTASEVGLGNVDNVQQYSANNPPPYPVTSVNGQTGAVSLSIPSSAADVGAEPALTEETVSTAGSVTKALDAGKIYHFTGALTALTITLNAAAAGQIAHYHFDFNCGSTAPTVTIPNTVTMPSGNTFDASKHYEVDILNNYGAVMAWATS